MFAYFLAVLAGFVAGPTTTQAPNVPIFCVFGAFEGFFAGSCSCLTNFIWTPFGLPEQTLAVKMRLFDPERNDFLWKMCLF